MTFLLAVVAVVVLLHVYLYWRLVHGVAGGRKWRLAGAVVVALLGAGTLAAFGLRAALSADQTRTLSWVGYLWLVLALYVATVLAVAEVPRAVLRRRVDPSRRRLPRVIAGAAVLVGAGTTGYGITQAASPQLVRREIPLDRWHPALDGFTIAVLSDVHIGAINGRPFLADVVDRVNAERTDLVAIVGDLVDGSVDELGPAASVLGTLRSPAYFVTGNHEYFSGAEQWCEFLPTIGVRVLRNERVAVGRPGGPTFDLAGIDDRTAARSGEPGHGANLDAALAGRDQSRPVVLLAHQPVMVDQAARRDVDLQISGHTHGGQILPLGYVVLLDQPVLAGLTRVGRTWLYVTRGVGFWGPPVRVGAPPEITLLTLRAARPA
ncbi:metallophosphoesterase [Pseudonocardia acaciae]|uniref:metallophosphoesterase n=1 Tax=Pseudonocardia acaciae TaxID=551276 RepID=UPI0007E8EDCB|nr:metallophosphoesterase [Pseudonocardia acaciae]